MPYLDPSAPFEFKRGDTFLVAAVLPESVRPTLAGAVARSQIRRPDGRLVATLDVTLTTDQIVLGFSGSTQDWQLGQVEIDVQFALTSGIVASTGTTTFNVVKDVTQV